MEEKIENLIIIYQSMYDAYIYNPSFNPEISREKAQLCKKIVTDLKKIINKPLIL